ncbi:MAG TPA: 16S rRNA (adenine(1518)-N(6)/adenine(1519)-N(6))-dimethyltransferase RsmA [Gemmatimonadales bacterium]|nr:16S rRNA (adenine(1518)-N(6)/adenine(1519)-N(6))-dimethyltransferase RsmA [Gemmatimonadales bacterium]
MPHAKRRLGQHFLADPRLLARIADALEAGPADTVLEIGPGTGGLTGPLLGRAGRLIAIEKDRDLVPALRERFPGVDVREGDALELDWHALAPGGIRLLITGNIPYNITSPLIDKALLPPRPKRIVFLVQKEVADRVTAVPGTSAYGALSIGVQAVAHAERIFTVPAGAFHPRPKVDSAVLRLTPLREPLIRDDERECFRTMVVGLFGFRRKQLVRGLRELTGWDAERVNALLAENDVPGTVRPEVLSPAAFVRLHGAVVDGGWSMR